MTITGGFPVRILASVKIRSRLGVRCAEMHPAETVASRTTRISPGHTRALCLMVRKIISNNSGLESVMRLWTLDFRPWAFFRLPLTINQARYKSSSKAVVDVNYGDVGGA